MGEACEVLSTPVTGGNVSLYNESPRSSVYPTPVVGMVGVLESIDNVTRSTFENEGDAILLVGDTRDELGGTEYLATIHSTIAGQPPVCDLELERRAIEALLEAIDAGAIISAHDCSDGGLAVALAECCIANLDAQLGADVDISEVFTGASRSAFFGETQGRYVLSSTNTATVEKIMQSHGVTVTRIGIVTPRSNGLKIRFNGTVIDSDIESLSSAWHNSIPSIMSAPAVAEDPEPAMTVV
jgi:phosphoribosylformylglycinamidine synthase